MKKNRQKEKKRKKKERDVNDRGKEERNKIKETLTTTTVKYDSNIKKLSWVKQGIC